MSLRKLYLQLMDYSNIEFQTNTPFFELDDINNIRFAEEKISLKGNQEEVEIANLGEYYVVTYSGETDKIKNTIDSLRLPKNFNGDLGEKLFYLF